jgi:hypothetical protein
MPPEMRLPEATLPAAASPAARRAVLSEGFTRVAAPVYWRGMVCPTPYRLPPNPPSRKKKGTPPTKPPLRSASSHCSSSTTWSCSSTQ